MSQESLLAEVKVVLESEQIPYMITGSVASSFHGLPRSTQDIDIIIAPDRRQLSNLVASFPKDKFYISEDAASDALAQGGMFNLIDGTSGWKVDFIIPRRNPFALSALGRRKVEDLSGLPMYLISAEDSIISKLDWARQTDSEKQLKDIAGILLYRGSDLDLDYMNHWIEALDLKAEWDKARKIASAD